MTIRKLLALGVCALLSLVAGAQSINPPKEIHLNTADLDVRIPYDGVHVKTVYTDTTLLFFIEIDAGSSSAHHNHADEQTMLFHSGRVRAVVGDREYEVGAGDVIIVSSYIPHQFHAIEDATWTEVHGPGFNNARKWESANN